MLSSFLITKKGSPYPYGATLTYNGVNFAVYVKDAVQVQLYLFHESFHENPIIIDLDPHVDKTGSVWHICVEAVPEGSLYTYFIKHSFDDSGSFVLDPYAKGVFGGEKWGEIYSDWRVELAGQFRLACIYHDDFDWEKVESPKLKKQELIIYEMHVRGFTRDESSQVAYPGTFCGMIEKIPFLVDLGVNAVELMPIHDFNENEYQRENPVTHEKLCNYFGYSPLNFFSLMRCYGTGQKHVNREFKELVKAFHKNKIEVILDVVFNHTAEGNEKGETISFKALDPHTYYLIDANGHYYNFSGCGNTLNCNHPICLEFIIDALRYFVSEFHVDGFRFDLASIMYRGEQGHPLFHPPLVEAITKDPMLSQVKLIAEPWDAGGFYQVGHFAPYSPRWSEWNGKYRDVVRRFIKGTGNEKRNFATAICGSQNLFGNRSPLCSVNFITAHDGFTLLDLVSYSHKYNLSNAENNRDGTNDNNSWNCGFEGPTSNKRVLALRRRQQRNFMLALMISQGIPMILMGDEYGHTKEGNNNTWCQDNRLNWYLWDQLENNKGLFRFLKLLIEFRKSESLLNREDFLRENEITWHGVALRNPDWEGGYNFLAFTLNDSTGMPLLYVAFNADYQDRIIEIPSPAPDKVWTWVVDTHNDSPDDFVVERKSFIFSKYIISSYSSIVLKSY